MWTNPAVERCRAELALNVAVKVFDRLHRAKVPDKNFNHQLTKCLHWHWECTRNLPGIKVPREVWNKTNRRLKMLDPMFDTARAQNHDAAAEQMVILAGVAGMMIIDVLVSCPDYHNQNWRYLSDTTDTLCLNFLYPLFPDAEEQAAKLWFKVG